MNNKISRLAEPFNIGQVTIKNRFCYGPMGVNVYDSNGWITSDGIRYYAERAKGGFGLIYTGAMVCDSKVDPITALSGTPPLSSPFGFMKSAREMNNMCHRYGAKVFAQLTMGLGRNYEGLKAPSEVEVFGDPTKKSEALTIEEIHEKEQSVIDTAVLMKQSGFDGVEVHALHWGYLLDQFAMSITNQRTDEYGGSLENRLRPCKNILEGIKRECGEDFPVTIRLGLKTYIQGLNKASFTGENEAGRTLEEGVEICKLLESYGYDALDVDAGVYDSFYYACPPMYVNKGFTIELAKAAKVAVNIPILIGGARIDEPDLCLQAVAKDTGDAIVVARAGLADPHIPSKMIQGKSEEIKPCIGCNACIHTLLNGEELTCAVNPRSGREMKLPLNLAVEKKDVLVIGGGLAGMEAAVTATMRGHSVTIYEKTDQLGGNLQAAGAHDFKRDIHRLNEWYKRKVEQLGIQVKYNTLLTTQQIIDLKPNAAIFATGSDPVTLNFEGSDRDNVMYASDAILSEREVGNAIVIVGGGQIGCEVAIDYANKGKKVTIVEGLSDILSSGAAVPFMNKMYIVDALDHLKVDVIKNARLDSVDDKGVTIKIGEEISHIDADTVVLSVGYRSVSVNETEFAGTGIETYIVGDANKVGDVQTTVANAYEIAHLL